MMSHFFFCPIMMKYQRSCPSKTNGIVSFWSNYLPAVAPRTLSSPLLFPCSYHQSFWWERAQFPSKIGKVSPACKTHSASTVRESFFDQEPFTVGEGLLNKGILHHSQPLQHHWVWLIKQKMLFREPIWLTAPFFLLCTPQEGTSVARAGTAQSGQLRRGSENN